MIFFAHEDSGHLQEGSRKMQAITIDNLKQAHILIVDDEQSVRDVAQQALQRFEFTHISTAANGEEALVILRREKVDVVLSDWNMPIMDGRTLLYTIRHDDCLRSIRVIIMSGGEQALEHAITTFGANDTILKPFEIGALQTLIQSVLTAS